MKTNAHISQLIITALLGLLLLTSPAGAQVIISNTNTYTENFNGMATNNTASLPTGWKMSAAGQGTTNTFWTNTANSNVVSQAASSGSPNAGGRYNWGFSNQTTNRAIGFLTSGSFAEPNSVMVAFTNTTGLTITNLEVSFDLIRFRTANTAISNVFYMSDSSTNWGTALSTNSWAAVAATNYFFTTNVASTNIQSVSLTNAINIADGGVFYMMWTFDPTAASNSQGIGLDNFSMNIFTAAGDVGNFWVGNNTTLGGSGTWTATGGTSWRTTDTDGTGGPFDPEVVATFGGATAGTVTVSGTVAPEAGIAFKTTGYIVEGDDIDLAGASISANNIGTDANVTATIDSKLTGSTGLTKSGSGTLILGGANDYTGGTVVSGGRLVGTTTSLQGDIANNAAVTFNQSTNGTYSSAMSGGGSLLKDGAGTVTLTGANSYSGGTEVAAGRLVGDTHSLQGAITNNAAVTFDQSTNGTYAGNMTGSGSLLKDGTGTVTLSGTNSYSGGTEVANGGIIGTTASVQGDIVNDGTVTFNQATNGTYAGEMSGSGQLIKNGGGNVTVTASNSYTGGTIIDGGTLTAADDNALGIGDVAVAGTARLLASGGVTIANDITVGQGNAVLYSQDFNALGEDGLPTGWGVYTNATASSMGSSVSFSTNQVEWANASGAFKNFASATGLTSSSDATAQNASEDRALGMRQTGSFGDPGAAFTYSFSTTGTNVDSISLDMMMLSVQTRSTAWTIQYGLGENPTSFTTLGTWSDPGTWGTTPLVFTTNDFGTALNNQDDIVFRVVALTGSTGSNNRDSMGLDNFVLGSGTSVSAAGGTIGTTNGTAIFTGLVTLDGTAQLLAGANSEAVFTGVLAGDGGIKTIGAGTVTLGGSSANTYEGDTTVATGTLRLAKDDDTTAVAGDISVASGATLLIAANNQVADTSEITLSGGTIKIDGVVTETFGNLNVTSASFLDFNDAIGANLSFDAYTPVELLTINNFIGLSTLTFNTNLTDYINDTQYFSFANGFTSAEWDSESGVFTITAIPEPSAYAAAAGLLGMMLWPARRRILRDTKRILGLRAPMRDRLGRRDA